MGKVQDPTFGVRPSWNTGAGYNLPRFCASCSISHAEQPHQRIQCHAQVPNVLFYPMHGILVRADDLVDQKGWPLASRHALFPIAWQTVDAVCQGPVLHPAPNCTNRRPNRPVIRWMSVDPMLRKRLAPEDNLGPLADAFVEESKRVWLCD